MSHITTIKTQITDLDAAEEALQELGLETRRNDFVQLTWSRNVQADLVTCRIGNTWGIGLEKAPDGTYNIIADWFYVRSHVQLSSQDFEKSLRQRYAYVKVKKLLDENGFRILNEGVDEQKSIRLEVTRWK